MQERLKRLKEISEELHDLANSFAGDENGESASSIHMASGILISAGSAIESGDLLDVEGIVQRAERWGCDIALIRAYSSMVV